MLHVYRYYMMTNVTFLLPEETVRRLRRRAADRGRKKGVMSDMVDAAITAYLDRTETARRVTLTAKKGDEVVAVAGTLEELSKVLKAKRVDWRSVMILSSEPVDPVVHLGLRTRPA